MGSALAPVVPARAIVEAEMVWIIAVLLLLGLLGLIAWVSRPVRCAACGQMVTHDHD